MRILGRWLAAAGLAGGLMGWAGCAGRERPVDAGVREGILLIGNGAEPPDLDPHIVTGVPEFHIMDAVFEGLVDIEPDTGLPAPGMAQSWEMSEDGTVYTFHLRPGAKWSDGVPIEAAEIIRGYERILNPELGAEYAYLFAIVQGAQAYNRGETTDFATVGFEAPDPYTLVIRLEHPVPYFLSLMTYECWNPVPIHVIEKVGGLRMRGSGWTKPEHLAASGPFKLKSWQPNRVIEVERNPYYWDAETVTLNEIHFFPVDSIDTEERMFRSGQLHKTNEVPVTKIATYEAMADSPLRIDPQFGTYYYRLNVTRPPFDDVRVRRALGMAIDRESIVTKITMGGQVPARSFSPPGVAGFQPRVEIHRDLEQARALLAEAGYPGGAGFPTVELLYNTSETHRAIAEAIQQMWKRDLGIDVQLYNQEWKVYLDTMNELGFDIARSGWVSVYEDANQYLEIMTTGNPNNRTGWANPAYDALHARSMAELDPAKRLVMLQDLDAMLVEQMPLIPIYHYTRDYLIDPRVKGWWPNALDIHPYKYVRLEE